MFEELLTLTRWEGVILCLSTLLIIAVSRWCCIAGEYWFGKRIWMAFLIVGLALAVTALFVESVLLSTIIAVAGFCYLWGIGEVIQQETRVRKGWFPRNPRRTYPWDGETEA